MLNQVNKEMLKISEKIMNDRFVSTGMMSEKLSSKKFWEIIGKPSNNIFPEISQKNI